jgi:glycosyltransferase involved in cell wall biosynthesis
MPVLISIVTVVYNGVSEIENTIQNVLGQAYTNLEYIVIDGGSTDGTLQIIEKYKGKLAYFVSEKDGGIYEAMNKAIPFIKGEWVNFMNCGDRFESAGTIARVFENNTENYDFIYGDYIADYEKKGRRLIKATIPRPPYQMILSHQSVFVRTRALKKFPFDTSYRISADLKFYEQCWKDGLKFHYHPQVISIRSHAGLSDTNRALAFQESGKVLMEFYDHDSINRMMKKLQFMHVIKSGAKKILPAFLQRLYRKNL